MILLRNLALFFVLFLPAACATGLVTGALEGPVPGPRAAYPIARFLVSVLPLLIPAVLAVPVLHFAYRGWLRDRPARRSRRIAVIATPLGLLAGHLAVFGTAYWSAPLLVLICAPGALYGALFGIPRRRAPKIG